MAEQKSTVQLDGTIGNVTYFKSQDGYMAKAKSGVSKDKMFSDPQFERTRENMSEFGNAASTGKILRVPFNSLLALSADSRMISRLVRQCSIVQKTDTVSILGQRLVANGDLSLFSGFEFNIKASLSATLRAPYTVTFNRTTGSLQLDVPSFIPKQGINAPSGTTHYLLQLAAAPVDFTVLQNLAYEAASAALPWDNNATTALSIPLSLPANSAFPVFVSLQIQFMKQVNGVFYSLQTGEFNACAIILVNIP